MESQCQELRPTRDGRASRSASMPTTPLWLAEGLGVLAVGHCVGRVADGNQSSTLTSKKKARVATCDKGHPGENSLDASTRVLMSTPRRHVHLSPQKK